MKSKTLAGVAALLVLTLASLGVQARAEAKLSPAVARACSLPTFCTGLGTCVCPNQTCSKGICR